MARTLFIVDDDVFGALPDAVQKALLAEAQKIFSFASGFKVEARKPPLFPAVLHFTDSVVRIVESDDEVTGVANDIQRQEDTNIRFSIAQTGLRINLAALSLSPASDPDQGGVGGHFKTTALIGGTTFSVTTTFGVASLQTAEQAVVQDALQGRTKKDILKARDKAIAQKGLTGYFGKHESLISMREEMESELAIKHTPLKDWPQDLWDGVGKALARVIAHEARHQYIEAHSAKGLGADEATIFGDPNFEKFDGSDQSNILNVLHQFDLKWNSASLHLETCPKGQPSPFD